MRKSASPAAAAPGVMSTSARSSLICSPLTTAFCSRSCARVYSTIGDGFCGAGLGGWAQLAIKRNGNRLDAPNFARVFANGAVRRKRPAAGGVEDGAARPIVALQPAVGGALLRVDVRREIDAMEVTIAPGERLDDRAVLSPRCDPLDDTSQLVIRSDNTTRIVSLRLQFRDLVGGLAKGENVFRSHRIADLDVRTVERAHDHAAVHDRLHAAGPGGLGAGGRDLLRQFGGREQQLRR